MWGIFQRPFSFRVEWVASLEELCWSFTYQGKVMTRKFGLIVGLLLLVLCAGVAHAQAEFLSAPNRTDMVHDGRRGVIYIANQHEILRYRVSTRRFLSPFVFDANSRFKGIDISADGTRLAIADATSSSSSVWVYVVNLNTLARTKHSFPKEFSEDGTYSVQFASDGALLITSRFAGSGWVPMRRMARNGSWSTIAEVRQNTMLSASGDRQTVAFAESNISDGRWGLYDVPTGQTVRRQWYEDGTSWFNYEIATDRFGSQFAIPTYGGAYIYGTDYQLLTKLGTYAGAQPVGVAYHPVENEIFFPWAGETRVRVYSSVSLRLKRAVEIGDLFQNNGNMAFESARTRLSADGSLLMVTVPGGLRYVQMYAPLTARDVFTSTTTDTRIAISLKGMIGNNGKVTYSLYGQPRYGRAKLYGSRVSYWPAAGFKGTDTFTYVAHYGEAVVAATVTVNVK